MFSQSLSDTSGCPVGVQVLGVPNKGLSKAHRSNKQSADLFKVKLQF